MGEPNLNRRKRILCVDDERDSVGIRKIMLEKGGAEVLLAYDAQACLKVISQEDVDLVLLDYHLGANNPDGELLAQDIRAMRPGLPLIMLTGDPMTIPSVRDSVDELYVKGQGNPRQLLESIERLVPGALPLWAKTIHQTKC